MPATHADSATYADSATQVVDSAAIPAVTPAVIRGSETAAVLATTVAVVVAGAVVTN